MSFEIVEKVVESLTKYINSDEDAAKHLSSVLHLLFVYEVPSSIRDRILQSFIRHIDNNESIAQEISQYGYIFEVSPSLRDRILEGLMK
jgi:hypothetical protein